MLMVIGVAGSYDSWKPLVYGWLDETALESVLIIFVPYLHLIILFTGMFLTFKSTVQPLRPTQDRVKRGKF